MNTNNFSLSRPKEDIFPKELEFEENIFSINSDFRVILKIDRMLKDENILKKHKSIILCQLFFNSRIDENLGLFLFGEFMKNGKTDKKEKNQELQENQFCFEFDAEEILDSFWTEKHIDLSEIDFLHWYKFLIYFKNLSSKSSFRQKISLRFKDLTDFKGKDLEELRQSKENVQLPSKSKDEINKQMQAITYALMNDGDLTELLKGDE